MKIVSQHRHDIDWLRVLGVLLLVPFHAAQIFILDPNSIMYVKDTINSRALTFMAGFIHMWHMPLLFIISGSATYLALGVRSAGQYIRERFLRLFVPLTFGILTYIPLTTYIQHSKTTSLPEAYLGFFHIRLRTPGRHEWDIYTGTSVVHPLSVYLFLDRFTHLSSHTF